MVRNDEPPHNVDARLHSVSHASPGAVLPRPLQAIQVAVVQKAVRSRAKAEAALPPDLVLPYLVLIGRVRLFREREPETQLRADLDRAKRDKDTDAIKQLLEQLESLGFNERVRVPTTNELWTEIQTFVAANYDRSYDELVAAKKFCSEIGTRGPMYSLRYSQS